MMELVDLTATSGSTGGSNGTPKPLYMFGSWEELETKVNSEGSQLPATLTTATASVKETLSTLNEMCLSGVLADMGKDEELAYLNYNRYLTAYILLSQRDEYKSMTGNGGLLKVEENVDLIAGIVATLKQSLIRRYGARLAQKVESEKNILAVLEQHRDNIEAEIEASRKLKKVREDLGSLRMVKQLLEEDSSEVQQQQQANPAQGANEQAVVDNDNVPEQLKCPVCFEIFQEEVLQCRNGHSICSTCYNDVKTTGCPECRIKFVDGVVVRNRALEGLVSSWKIDCPFRDNGCQDKILCKEMSQHADACLFGKSEERRQIIKVEMDIKVKEGVVRKWQESLQQAYLKRVKTETKWRELESNKGQTGSLLDKIVKDFNLREKEHELLLETRQLSLA